MKKLFLAAMTAVAITTIYTSSSAIASPISIQHSSSLTKIESLKIVNADGQFSNVLIARHKPVKKGLKLEYRWLMDGKPIWTEDTSEYEKQPNDCGHRIQVKVTLKSSKKILDTKTSASYDPAVCTFATKVQDAGYALYSCGIDFPNGQCNSWQEKSFFGYVRGSASATSWFWVQIKGIEPGQVIGWRVRATGSFRGYALNNAMITRSKPEWTCCDFNGVKFLNGKEAAWVSETWPEISEDGNAYIGFSYFDKYGISETLVVDTIQVELEYR
jgi:hypothetical protein